MSVQFSISRFQWPSVVSGAITRNGWAVPRTRRMCSITAVACATQRERVSGWVELPRDTWWYPKTWL